MALIRLGYISTAVQLFTPEGAEWVAGEANRWYRERGVTGTLLYAGDTFLNVLEGEHEAVHELFDVIRSDERHIWIDILFEGRIRARMFDRWSMGLCVFTPSASPGRDEFQTVLRFIQACGSLDLDAVTRGLIRMFEVRSRAAA